MRRLANNLTAETHRRPYVCEADWQVRWTIVDSLTRVLESVVAAEYHTPEYVVEYLAEQMGVDPSEVRP